MILERHQKHCGDHVPWRGMAAIVEVGLNYTVKLPVEPMLFRLLRVGKLIRAIRMVAWASGWVRILGGGRLKFGEAMNVHEHPCITRTTTP